jgi:hypothetical protein
LKWKSFFEERKKDWNRKPGEPFGENALIIFEVIFIILCHAELFQTKKTPT